VGAAGATASATMLVIDDSSPDGTAGIVERLILAEIPVSISIKKLAQFISGSLYGLDVNITVLTIILINFSPPFKFIVQVCGIAAGMIVNFTFSKNLVFRKKYR
jgi:hypothetical protein